MSTEGEPLWDSLPDHLKTSKLAHAICPEQAEEAAHDLQEILFMGAWKFNMLSRAELGTYLWRGFGDQMAAMSDGELLAWMRHMDFCDHSAFEGMRDDEIIQFIRQNEAIVAGLIEQYPSRGDFRATINEPSTDPEALRRQVRKLFSEDQELQCILVAVLEHPEAVPGR
ncbi:MAG: hypothetical protein ABIG34_00005 [Candidatus Peregrinibacteria bacterium]